MVGIMGRKWVEEIGEGIALVEAACGAYVDNGSVSEVASVRRECGGPCVGPW